MKHSIPLWKPSPINFISSHLITCRKWGFLWLSCVYVSPLWDGRGHPTGSWFEATGAELRHAQVWVPIDRWGVQGLCQIWGWGISKNLYRAGIIFNDLGFFNLTMTYRTTSDVYLPYAKLVPKDPIEKTRWLSAGGRFMQP